MKLLTYFLTSFLIFTIIIPQGIFAVSDQNVINTIESDTHKIDQNLRIPFIQNQGQISEQVQYYIKTPSGSFYVTDYDLTYDLHAIENSDTRIVIKELLIGNKLQPLGTDKTNSNVNYLKGNIQNWKTEIPTYDVVSLGQVWEKINVKLVASPNSVEKIFTVTPGGNPSDIKIQLEGIEHLQISKSDQIVVDTKINSVLFSKPIAYQIINEQRHEVEVAYKILDSTTYGFTISSYDPSFDLVIDPFIISTFVGGSMSDTAMGLDVDSMGNVYVAGKTTSTDYPITAGVYDNTYNAPEDVFVSKLSSDLTTLIASTFVGGSGFEQAVDIHIDSLDDVYISGITQSADFPTTTGAYDETHNGADDIFVSKLSSDLTTLIASTFVGGFSGDYVGDMYIDDSGNIYIVGNVSLGYPTTTGAYDETPNGSMDAFVSKLSSDLTSLTASTLIGGSGPDAIWGMRIDSFGDVYVVGDSGSADYPTTTGVYDETHNGGSDVFVSKLSSDLTMLDSSTFIGDTDHDYVKNGIHIDSLNNVYVSGYTLSAGFPTTTGVYDDTHNGGSDVFVSKFNPDLTLITSTLIGGSDTDEIIDMYVVGMGDIYISGISYSADYPTTTGVYDDTHNGGSDVFVSKLSSDLTTLDSSTFIGATFFELFYDLHVDSMNNVYVLGRTDSPTFPTTTGVYDETYNGNSDVFVFKFAQDPVPEMFCGRTVGQFNNIVNVNNVTTFGPWTLLLGSNGDDLMRGNENTMNLMFGSAGDDCMIGGSMIDYIFGSLGMDEIHGGGGNDLLSGGPGNDIIFGDSGIDRIFGHMGDDTIDGGTEIDVCIGGPGSNTLTNCP